jgi:hypothetical protein
MGEIVARIGWIYEPRPIELDVQQLNVVRFCRGAKQGRTQENLRVGTNQVNGGIACINFAEVEFFSLKYEQTQLKNQNFEWGLRASLTARRKRTKSVCLSPASKNLGKTLIKRPNVN